MTRRSRKKRTGMSPYKKYGKRPYVYEFRSCGHKEKVRQSTNTWAGKICAACNVITEAFT